jgi:uncharacterized RDD family membrane protein YckC
MDCEYPSLLRRYLAALVDAIVAFCTAALIGKFLSVIYPTAGDSLLWVFFGTFLVYEPLFTTYAATLGQYLFRYRVKQLDGAKRIKLWQAVPRYVSKVVLGIVSLLTIPKSRHRRAIHDLLTRTVVVSI